MPPDEDDPLADCVEVDLARQLVVLDADGGIVASHAVAIGRTDVAGEAPPAGLHWYQILMKGPIENVPGVFVDEIVICDAWNEIGVHEADGRRRKPP